MYLLDTNVVSELRRTRPHGAVLAWLNAVPADQLHVSSVTFGELQAGAENVRPHDPAKAAAIEAWIASVEANWDVIAIDVPIFRVWAKLMHHRSDDLIEDAMIAATALVHGLTVVTRNMRDFMPFGVETLDPFATLR